MTASEPPVDVLVVGAGPTGLALAAQARAHGATVRIIDRNADRAHESRALAIQPRTLEVLTGSGVAGTLVQRGHRSVRLHMHAGGHDVQLPLFDLGMDDTEYPFPLFLSQAITEQVLVDHLAEHDVAVEREVRLVDYAESDDEVTGTLRRGDGEVERVRARYLAGCDGMGSIVRDLAGIEFSGDRYPQLFALADLEIEGLAPDRVHGYLTSYGPVLFFPLSEPASWRLVTLRPPAGWPGREGQPADTPVTLGDLQAVVDTAANDALRLHDPVWITDFRIYRKSAPRYRAGRVFLAGDAAHVHSPAGGQGMNIGIQDAWNLGWKLGLVVRGAADPELLDSYETERVPVGKSVVRFTDLGFRVATAANPVARTIRTVLAPRMFSMLRRVPKVRAAAFRTVAELTIDYRDSIAVQDGQPPPRGGPRAGDRLPGGTVVADGEERSLYELAGVPGFHLLLCGRPDAWPSAELEDIRQRYADLVSVHHLTGGAALPRLGRGPRGSVHYLVRPDSHVSYRAAGTDLSGLHAYLERWLPRSSSPMTGLGAPRGR
ncbi:FAD-dependent monooxygenase [Phytoactinopolyspora halotolerans]|uniref:Monooxygenase n=1 Tax=Phytoactinopolyspora halotolerans TaxID=1981512 RepID=A0A6L9S160_9ACTN|nr:FAD-dependent monooxygenase [Phytoactinopolyspora halotolerans]NED98895.1 monooxygenase [Phytoactinopolyspora halotolerans]